MGEELHVYGNASISGIIDFDDVLSFLIVDGNISWNSGSSVTTYLFVSPGQAQIKVKGNWTFMNGSQVNLEPLRVELVGTTPSEIICYSSNSSFFRLEICKVNSYANFSSLSIADMKIDENLWIGGAGYENAELRSGSSLKIVVGKFLDNFGKIRLDNGTLELAPQGDVIFNTGDYVNHLTLVGYLTNSNVIGTALINGNLTVSNYSFVYFDDNCILKGNLTNSNNEAYFNNLEFQGSSNQNCIKAYCDILTLNKTGGQLRFPSDYSYCDSYNWIQGTLRVNGGWFEAGDLVDPGIFGSIIITSGKLTYHQDAEQYIDLCGDVYMDGGIFEIYGGSGNSYWPYLHNASLTMYDGTLQFMDVGIDIRPPSSYTFTTTITGGGIKTRGDFIVQRSDFHPSGGSVHLRYGGSSDPVTLSVAEGSYLNSLWVWKENPLEIVTATGTLVIKGDFIKEYGNFIAPTTMYIGGNISISSPFTSGSGKVVINGNDDQTMDPCFADFNILELNKASGYLIIEDSEITAASYNWTAGSVYIEDASFEAYDLMDDGIYGTYELVGDNAVLIMHQDAGSSSYIDLNGHLTIGGGHMIVYGGADDSYWSYAGNASLTLTGGILDFVDNGIRVYNSGSYNFTENITGGTIRTGYNFRCDRTNFTPASGNLEMYGTTDASLYCVAGSNLFNVTIDKSAKSFVLENNEKNISVTLDKEQTLFPSDDFDSFKEINKEKTFSYKKPVFESSGIPGSFKRDKSFPDGAKSNTVTAQTNLDINGSFMLTTGYFTAPAQMNVAGNWTNNAGIAAFNEGTGLVTFDGNTNRYLFTNEIFYNLTINKTDATACIFTIETDLDLSTVNNLHIVDGYIELNSNSTLTVGGDLTINLNAGLNAYQDTGLEIYIAGDWTNMNTTYSDLTGFYPGTSLVVFNGSSDQNLYVNCPTGDFYNLTVNKSAGNINPISNSSRILNNFYLNNGKFVAPSQMTVGGSWTNLVGDAGFTEGDGIVIFDGNTNADINNSETFYNLTENKTQSGDLALELASSSELTVLNDFHIQDGCFEMNGNSTLDIANDLTIDLNAGLNCISDAGLNIYLGGDWTNFNVDYTTERGFNPGTSTVTFDGITQNQIIFTACPHEVFYNLVINKPGAVGTYSMEPADNLRVLGNVTVQNGNWHNFGPGLSHEFLKNITINPTGMWHDMNGTISFTGDADQYFNNQGFNNGYFHNVTINKPIAEKAVILNSDFNSDNNGELLIDEGLLYFVGHTAEFSGDIIVNSGGKITVGAGSVLIVGSDYNLDVNSGGVIEILGVSGNPATITHDGSGYYNFNINSGGSISAEYGIFEYMTDDGVDINSGGLVNPLKAFNHCEFRNGQAGGSMLTIDNDQTLVVEGATFPSNSWGSLYNVSKFLNTGNVTFTEFTGDFSGEDFDHDPNNRINWEVSGFNLSLKVFLEGPYNGTNMNTSLSGLTDFPLSQPYNTSPWNYSGAESVGSVPANVVDWILVELRDAENAVSATSATRIARQAGFLKNDGTIVGIDGVSNLQFTISIIHQLFVVVWYKNHLGILSSSGLTNSGGIYSWDFTTSSSQAYGGTSAQKSLPGSKWGMFSGDGNADDIINNNDKTLIWSVNSGKKGYLNADFSRDGQVNNRDKNDLWFPNLGRLCQVPD